MGEFGDLPTVQLHTQKRVDEYEEEEEKGNVDEALKCTPNHSDNYFHKSHSSQQSSHPKHSKRPEDP